MSTSDLRPARLAQRLVMQAAADHFTVALTSIFRTERGMNANHEFARRYRSWLGRC